MSFNNFINIAGGLALIIGALAFAYQTWQQQRSKVKDAADKIDFDIITRLEKAYQVIQEENVRLVSDNKLKDEQIKNLTAQLQQQQTDFQRQIDDLKVTISHLQDQATGRADISGLQAMLQNFNVIFKDIEQFHASDKQIITMLLEIREKMGLNGLTDKLLTKANKREE